MIDLKFPREIAIPQRFIAHSRGQYYQYINANIKHQNLFTSVFNYSELLDSHTIDYDSIEIDRVWFDFDTDLKKDGKVIKKLDAYGDMYKLHQFCIGNNLKHIVRFTGSGYDTTIFTKTTSSIQNKKSCLKNAVEWFEKKLNIMCDEKVKGDVARICRVTNSFNFKKKSQRFCVSLCPEIIDKGHDAIREYAKTQKPFVHVFGNELFDITKFDYNSEPKIEQIMSDIDTNAILNTKFDSLPDIFPPCVKYLASNPNADYSRRYIIILFLREFGFERKNIDEYMQTILSKRKYYHCIYEEKQTQHLCKSLKFVFPNQKEILKLKACPYALGEYCDRAKFGCLNYNRLP